jgi:hypothetical protein
MTADRERLREEVARQYGLKLYAQYTEEQAALEFLSVDVSTLKRWRRAGLTGYVKFGRRGVRYLGLHIADLLAFGIESGKPTRVTAYRRATKSSTKLRSNAGHIADMLNHRSA